MVAPNTHTISPSLSLSPHPPPPPPPPPLSLSLRVMPTQKYLRQWHPKARNLHATRSDRFPPLSKFPNHVPEAYGSVAAGDTLIPLGLPTPAEKALVNGELAGQADPFAVNVMLGDTEKPAEEVLLDSQHNNFLHKQQGEPISDSLIADWDLQNGVADP